MPKLEQPEQTFDLRVRSRLKDGQRLRVVEIQYIRTPDADARLSRAIDILLRFAAREKEERRETRIWTPIAKKGGVG